MSDSAKKSLLDVVPSGPVRSKAPFNFKGEPARWRVLDSLEIQACRHAAQKRAMDILVDDLGLDAKDAYPLVQAGSSADTQREWFEYYVIGAAMTDAEGAPVAMGTPDEVAFRLADETTPIERARLIDDYLQFVDENDPSNLSEEEIGEIIAALGKGEDSILLQQGSNALRSLLVTMGPRLARAEMMVAELQEQEGLADRVDAVEREISLMRRSLDGSD